MAMSIIAVFLQPSCAQLFLDYYGPAVDVIVADLWVMSS